LSGCAVADLHSLWTSSSQGRVSRLTVRERQLTRAKDGSPTAAVYCSTAALRWQSPAAPREPARRAPASRATRRVSAQNAATAGGGSASRDGAAGPTQAAVRRVLGLAAPRRPRSARRPAPARRRTGLVARRRPRAPTRPRSPTAPPADRSPSAARRRGRARRARSSVSSRSPRHSPQMSSTRIVDSTGDSGSTSARAPIPRSTQRSWWPRSHPRGGVGRCLPRLHTIVRGTPVLGYRQWPPGPPQERLQACRWGQSLIGVPFSGTC